MVKSSEDFFITNHFFLVTSLGAEFSAQDMLALYRKRGKTEAHMGEFMDAAARKTMAIVQLTCCAEAVESVLFSFAVYFDPSLLFCLRRFCPVASRRFFLS